MLLSHSCEAPAIGAPPHVPDLFSSPTMDTNPEHFNANLRHYVARAPISEKPLNRACATVRHAPAPSQNHRQCPPLPAPGVPERPARGVGARPGAYAPAGRG